MKIVCPKCDKEVAEVTSVARLTLTVHCPFDGTEFGVAVEAPAAPEAAPSAEEGPKAAQS
jgi:hypothetical protein